MLLFLYIPPYNWNPSKLRCWETFETIINCIFVCHFPKIHLKIYYSRILAIQGSQNFLCNPFISCFIYIFAAVASWYHYSTIINIFYHFLSLVFLSFTSLHVSPLLSHFSCQFQLTFSAAFNQTMKKQKFGFKNNTLVLRCLQLTYLEVVLQID